jgi:Fe-Mn family superoxide dismutase
MNRREFLRASARLGLLALLPAGIGCSDKNTPSLMLPALPYAPNALEPYISEQTISFHYGKHHRGYIRKTNALISGTRYAEMPLVEIIQTTSDIPEAETIYNNAAQAYNHTVYWRSMRPDGGGAPGGAVAELIDANFGSYEEFSAEFMKTGQSVFGSGWVWLVNTDTGVTILPTTNAETPVDHGQMPLLVLDVWEHAYYIDYQNRRDDYIQAFLNHLVNWDYVEKNLSKGAP